MGGGRLIVPVDGTVAGIVVPVLLDWHTLADVCQW